MYIGDWMENILKEIAIKRINLSEYCYSVDEFIDKLNLIDKKYTKEIEGRIYDFIVDIKNIHDAYVEKVRPAVKWFEEASSHSNLHNDRFMLAKLKEVVSELEESTDQAQRDVENAFKKIEDWESEHLNKK